MRQSHKWIQSTLIRFNYDRRQRRASSFATWRRFPAAVDPSHPTERRVGRLVRRQRTSNGFARRYTNADIQLIATLDNLHDQPNGKALKKLCERAYRVFGDSAYERLSTISVAHLYNLRKSKVYTRCRYTYTKTKSKASAIGERRTMSLWATRLFASVHQGDLDGRKGLYHQCARWKLPLEKISAFSHTSIATLNSFVILGFHSDNGSEYVNKTVRRTFGQDTATIMPWWNLGHVIRKQFGHAHIPQHYANQVNAFNECYLNAHINYHRPCLFPVTSLMPKAKKGKHIHTMR